MSTRRPTSTSDFGVGRRESHDSSAFYARFAAPEFSELEDIAEPYAIENPYICADARSMDAIADNSVALVVTSPPYFAGKQYETELGQSGVPSSYLEYLDLLRAVFKECARVLEPGGRIAVNVANLGRKPYRSLAGDVATILQDDLHLLLRGEVVWKKGDGASGSCAWGSFRSPMNPVLRDVTERIVIASKGRFDRALNAKKRREQTFPHAGSINGDEFMAATIDLWEIPPESARRVGHPAPFPVELPERLIHLYTFEDDLVLDPFMGSGTTLVAAARARRRYVGYDLDEGYVATAKRRVEEELTKVRDESAHASSHGSMRAAIDDLLERAGFVVVARNTRVNGVSVDLKAQDKTGASWYFLETGALTHVRSGLARVQSTWSCIGRAAALARAPEVDGPIVFLSSHLPKRQSEADLALRSVGSEVIFDVIDVQAPRDQDRLITFGENGIRSETAATFWSVAK